MNPILGVVWAQVGYVVFCSGLFQGRFLHDFRIEILTVAASKTRFSYGMYCQKAMFLQKLFFQDSLVDFECFSVPLDQFF